MSLIPIEATNAFADPPAVILRQGFNLVSIPEAAVPYGNLSNILQALGGGDAIERAYTFNPSGQIFYESGYDGSGNFSSERAIGGVGPS